MCVAAELPPDNWHTVVALDEAVVLLEIKAGPFNPADPKIFASWAAKENSKAGQEYLSDLRLRIILVR